MRPLHVLYANGPTLRETRDLHFGQCEYPKSGSPVFRMAIIQFDVNCRYGLEAQQQVTTDGTGQVQPITASV